jgi:hypothetical protein
LMAMGAVESSTARLEYATQRKKWFWKREERGYSLWE